MSNKKIETQVKFWKQKIAKPFIKTMGLKKIFKEKNVQIKTLNMQILKNSDMLIICLGLHSKSRNIFSSTTIIKATNPTQKLEVKKYKITIFS